MDDVVFKVTKVHRKIYTFATERKDTKPTGAWNVTTELRINKWEFLRDGTLDVWLIFKMEYYPKAFMEKGYVGALVKMNVIDVCGFLKEDPCSDQSISLFPYIYLETFESLATHLTNGVKEKFGHGFEPPSKLSSDAVFNEIKRVFVRYFKG